MGSLNDPIADLLTQIRNAGGAKKRFLDLPHSRIREAIVKILKENGYVAHYLVKEENKLRTMRIFLKYGAGRRSVFQQIKRVSKPSLRRYVSCSEIPRVFGGMGISILSTPKGVIDGRAARKKNVGGELLCIVW